MEVTIVRIIGIVWLDYILEKLYKKHDVSQDEIKEILIQIC